MGLRVTLVVASLACAASARAETELKNDGFVSGQTAGFQQGFVAGEIGASRFVAPEQNRQLIKVQILFGGSTAQQTVRMRVWDDTNGGLGPGAELSINDFQLTGSSSALQELVLPSPLPVPMQFRVGIEFLHDGLPSIARDVDNTIEQSKNYIMASGIGWQRSSTLGLTGDWIIRAVITDGAVAPPDGAPGDAGVQPGGDCSGSPDCPQGQFCENGSCTFECRMDDDCGGGTCNSLGQCVGGEPDSGGCCQSDRGGAVGFVMFGIAVLALVLRRRRRCCG